MDQAKKEVLADLLVGFVAMMSTGHNMEKVISEVRQLEKNGVSPEDISKWLKETADAAVKEMFKTINEPKE
jgi:hypothetical protein